jgi:hypothetical protein
LEDGRIATAVEKAIILPIYKKDNITVPSVGQVTSEHVHVSVSDVVVPVGQIISGHVHISVSDVPVGHVVSGHVHSSVSDVVVPVGQVVSGHVHGSVSDDVPVVGQVISVLFFLLGRLLLDMVLFSALDSQS